MTEPTTPDDTPVTHTVCQKPLTMRMRKVGAFLWCTTCDRYVNPSETDRPGPYSFDPETCTLTVLPDPDAP